MKLIDRLSLLGGSSSAATPSGVRAEPIHIPPLARGPATAEVQEVERRIAVLNDEITQLEAKIEGLALRRQAADNAVRDLSEEAAAGTLQDPARLAKALQHQREVAADTGEQAALDRLRDERGNLSERILTLRREAAKEAYSRAVEDYAKACAPLVGLAQRVREAAVDAGVLVTEANSKHLVGTWVQIGGAVINLPKA
jgi:chromosome segregation ATPase